MEETIKPNDNDIISGRSKGVYQHPGNISFQKIVSAYAQEFNQTATDSRRREIVSTIEDEIRNGYPSRRFLNQNKQSWKVLCTKSRRQKIVRALRDAPNIQESTAHSMESSHSCPSSCEESTADTMATSHSCLSSFEEEKNENNQLREWMGSEFEDEFEDEDKQLQKWMENESGEEKQENERNIGTGNGFDSNNIEPIDMNIDCLTDPSDELREWAFNEVSFMEQKKPSK